MPYYRRVGGSHYRREHGKMVKYVPGDLIWMEEWEVEPFGKSTFEAVHLEAGRAELSRKGIDPAVVEGRLMPLPEPEVEIDDSKKEKEKTEETPPEPEVPPEVGLKIDHRGGGKYNVVNQATGTPLNDALLTKAEAEGLVASMAELDAIEKTALEVGREEEEETTTDTETDPVVSTEDVAGEDGVHIRRGTKPPGDGESETGDEES